MTLTTIKPAGLSKPVDLADNEKIRLGTGNDLEIYHDGTNSHINNTTGYIVVGTDSYAVKDQTLNEFYIKALKDGAVELYHNNIKRIETTSAGASVGGALSVSNGISLPDLKSLKLGDNDDFVIVHTGFASYINNNSGDLYIRNDNANDNANILIQAIDGENSIYCHDDGSVELYYDNSKKLNTHASGVEILGKLYMADSQNIELGNSQDFLIYHNGSHSIINDNGTGDLQLVTNNGGKITLQGGSDTMANFIKDGAVELYHDNSKKLETTASGVDVTGYLKTSTYLWADTKVFSDQWVSKSSTNGHDMYIYSRDAAGNNAIQAEFKIGQVLLSTIILIEHYRL